ncbi:TPA: hypothetical protein JG832_002463 [Enterobacter hormaechei subsp. xiangfangensis]|nr:hypothetical protein [Enterobacter hormaechei subsp. xiangfangensis]HAV1890598.1 hypothetical protein [Enterobacter hormaechei subsp. xiangfangensis]
MKMKKAEFIQTAIDLLDNGCSSLNIYQYAGLMMTELHYITRRGERRAVKVCDSHTEEGRNTQKITYSSWLKTAELSWKGIVTPMASRQTYQETAALVRNTIYNLIQSRKLAYTPTMNETDVARVLVITARDVMNVCTHLAGSQAICDMLAAKILWFKDAVSGKDLEALMEKVLDTCTEEMQLISDRQPENQQSPIDALRFGLGYLTCSISIEKEFTPEFNAKLARYQKRMLARCQDEAFHAWVKCNWINAYVGDMSVAEVLEPLSELLTNIINEGELPCSEPFISEQDFYERGWWNVTDVRCTYRSPEGIYHGYGEVMDIEGVLKLRVKFEMNTGKEAIEADLPAIVSIVGAEIRVPEALTIVNDDGVIVDLLEAVQELDSIEGFSADIFNEVYTDYLQ